jgi:hypothetical protein
MNIGSLHQVKKRFWLLFPTKETADLDRFSFEFATAATASRHAAWYNRKYNYNVSWFSPESFVVFLEEDGKLKKFLTSEGLIGWTQVNKAWLGCFEEVKSE